jgi:hypothetical protein
LDIRIQKRKGTEMRFLVEKIKYETLNARQKETYNFQKVSAIFADYGFTTIKLSDDWLGADFIAIDFSGEKYLKVQLKGRLTFDKKYKEKDLWICFNDKKNEKWYLYHHDELLKSFEASFKKTSSWKNQGIYHFPNISVEIKEKLLEYMPTKTNLSTESQITRGIEQLALGWQFMSNPENEKKKVPIELMINILEESYNDLPESEENGTDYLDRRYRNYREKLGEKPFYIKIDFQKKIIQKFKGNEENIRLLSKTYLENYAEDYNDYILENYFKVQKENGLLEYSLFQIVFFNLASRLGLTVEMTYDNILDSSKKRRRRIRPIGVSCRRPYLNLIALDCNDKIYKHFVLSCITEIHTDIFEFANDSERKRTNLDLKYFRNSKDYRFGKEYVTYRIELKKKFLRHFRNVYFPEFETIEESSDAVILEVTTWDYRYFFNAIFNYREHCLLLAPTDKVAFYKDILLNTLKNYSED